MSVYLLFGGLQFLNFHKSLNLKLGYLPELVQKTIRKSLFVLQLSGHRGLGLGVCPDDGVDLLNLSVEIVLLHCQLLLHNVHIIDGPGDVDQAGDNRRLGAYGRPRVSQGLMIPALSLNSSQVLPIKI